MKLDKKCAKCGRKDDGWLLASVDINDVLCINCLDRFNEWCETHPGEPYSNFIHPKPWMPKYPGFIMFEVDGKMHAHLPSDGWLVVVPEYEEELERTESLFDPPYGEIYLEFDATNETAELSSEMAQLLWYAANDVTATGL